MIRLFRIHPSPNTPYITTVACCGDAARALELAKGNNWIAPQLTSEAVAVECEEIWEEGV